jgi:hypothetical protein
MALTTYIIKPENVGKFAMESFNYYDADNDQAPFNLALKKYMVKHDDHSLTFDFDKDADKRLVKLVRKYHL